MRAIIINDNDARQLVDRLKIANMDMKKYGPIGVDYPQEMQKLLEAAIEDIHRKFHYEVVRWLQDQGAQLSR